MLLAPFAIRLLRLQPPDALWETSNTNRQEVLIEFSFQTTRYGIKFCILLHLSFLDNLQKPTFATTILE